MHDVHSATTDTVARITGFMARALDHGAIDAETDIFATGLANSLFAMQLVQFVEREFGIEIGAEDLELENFRTIRRIAALVARKRQAEVAA
ncbi:MAG: acyl carrier protein [Azospirillaceae bacterium]|nr:acyl carrier protein [Azospirillaceae bacterium]